MIVMPGPLLHFNQQTHHPFYTAWCPPPSPLTGDPFSNCTPRVRTNHTVQWPTRHCTLVLVNIGSDGGSLQWPTKDWIPILVTKSETLMLIETERNTWESWVIVIANGWSSKCKSTSKSWTVRLCFRPWWKRDVFDWLVSNFRPKRKTCDFSHRGQWKDETDCLNLCSVQDFSCRSDSKPF